MGMPRNGWRIRRSLSPVIRQEAFAEMATSGNLLSFGSRQSVMIKSGLKSFELASDLYINVQRSSSSRKYLSNFLRNNTSINPSNVLSEIAKIPENIALFKAFLLEEYGRRAQLINTFVSKTKKSLLILQYVIQNFFCETSFLHSFTNFVKIFFKFLFRISHQLFGQSQVYPLGYFIFLLGRRKPPFFCSSINNFNNNPFQFLLITSYKSNLQKLSLQ